MDTKNNKKKEILTVVFLNEMFSTNTKSEKDSMFDQQIPELEEVLGPGFHLHKAALHTCVDRCNSTYKTKRWKNKEIS
ncbi:unnamed protein product [Arctia plantaginis]|uniref:Uncharacterized protein n=1 Tax=Arctia plantaginis TaxID=874455 RepID=A0A8S0Z3D1_ARCPL|nr:unnamed protein product [Arctia plantaginis]